MLNKPGTFLSAHALALYNWLKSPQGLDERRFCWYRSSRYSARLVTRALSRWPGRWGCLGLYNYMARLFTDASAHASASTGTGTGTGAGAGCSDSRLLGAPQRDPQKSAVEGARPLGPGDGIVPPLHNAPEALGRDFGRLLAHSSDHGHTIGPTCTEVPCLRRLGVGGWVLGVGRCMPSVECRVVGGIALSVRASDGIWRAT